MSLLDKIKKMISGNNNEKNDNSVVENIAADNNIDNIIKKDCSVHILSPLTGLIVDLADVPDPVFAEKIVGNGIAIDPFDNKVCAPFDGVVSKLFHTHHALIITSKTGVEIMIHVGLDTVQLNGEGFTPKVNEGDTVKAGQILLELDLDLLKEKAKAVFTPVILINEDDSGSISNIAKGGEIKVGDLLYQVG